MNNIIYKYLPVERLSYFENELLRITQPGDLNDPFECLPVTPSIQDLIEVLSKLLEERIKIIEKSKLPKAEKQELKNRETRNIKTEITNVRKIKPGNFRTRFYHEATAKINSQIGILSLSRRWDSTLMWAHYSTSHKGFCVGFDADNPFFSNYRKLADLPIVFMPVIYDDNRVKIPINKGETIDPNCMLTKSKDWGYEEEERLLVLLSKARKRIKNSPYDICLFHVPHSLIKEVIVGANISDTNLHTIQKFCSKKNINLYHCEISEYKFDMTRTRK